MKDVPLNSITFTQGSKTKGLHVAVDRAQSYCGLFKQILESDKDTTELHVELKGNGTLDAWSTDLALYAIGVKSPMKKAWGNKKTFAYFIQNATYLEWNRSSELHKAFKKLLQDGETLPHMRPEFVSKHVLPKFLKSAAGTENPFACKLTRSVVHQWIRKNNSYIPEEMASLAVEHFTADAPNSARKIVSNQVNVWGKKIPPEFAQIFLDKSKVSSQQAQTMILSAVEPHQAPKWDDYVVRSCGGKLSADALVKLLSSGVFNTPQLVTSVLKVAGSKIVSPEKRFPIIGEKVEFQMTSYGNQVWHPATIQAAEYEVRSSADHTYKIPHDRIRMKS